MNQVMLIGRITKDIEVRYTASQTAVTSFTLAVDRPVKAGDDKQADFPRITVFGRQAENCEKFLGKGSKVAVEGRIQTGSYKDKDGNTVYTTDVIANRVEFLDSKKSAQNESGQKYSESVLESFETIDEDVPF